MSVTIYRLRWMTALLALALVLAACDTPDEEIPAAPEEGETATEPAETTPPDETAPDTGETTPAEDPGEASAARDSEWFDEAQFEQELAWRDVEPEGPEGEPWLQYIEPNFVDTSEFAAEGPYTLCFSNIDVGNPWRVVGWDTMQAEVALHEEIGEFRVSDAGGDIDTQISDIQQLAGSGDCDVLIVSPGTTEALTPAVEQACEQVPTIVFDRGVLTDCTVTFIKPIGGYAFGADAAEFIIDNVPEGGNVFGLRILPGVDVLETRWVAGQVIMEEAGLNIIGNEFTEGDPARAKSLITELLQRGETLDGVWMDSGATSVAVAEAFEDEGLPVPPITGEDQNDFLQKWAEDDLTAVAPTYPVYQWRTPILAALMILRGEEVPDPWILPQPLITEENLDQFLQPDMPPLHYATCGCEDMPGFPEDWQ